MIAGGYLAALLLRLGLRWQYQRMLDRVAVFLERALFICFTALVIYCGRKELISGMAADIPFVWTLFAWAVASVHIFARAISKNQSATIFAHFWVVAALGFSPTFLSDSHRVFAAGIDWLNFYRVMFLAGYAFYVLALPLALLFLWKAFVLPQFREVRGNKLNMQLEELDRQQHLMILWSLPFLTVGLMTKILLNIESGAVGYGEVLNASRQEFLTIATWLTCAFYLHAKMFLRWRDQICALVYMAGFAVVLSAHFSGRVLLQIS